MNKNYTMPDEMGFYGDFGGAFIPELLRANTEELLKNFKEIKEDKNNLLSYLLQEEFLKQNWEAIKEYSNRIGIPLDLNYNIS